MGLYALFLAGSNFLAPIMSGFINDGQGWQWVLVCPIAYSILESDTENSTGVPSSTALHS